MRLKKIVFCSFKTINKYLASGKKNVCIYFNIKEQTVRHSFGLNGNILLDKHIRRNTLFLLVFQEMQF